MKKPNYDKYKPKHFARFYGWLPASKEFKKKSNRDSIKFFTLCAKQAIDVFMFEKEKILKRDNNRKLPNVFICERKAGDAMEIFELVRPPVLEAIFIGPLEEILTFQEKNNYRNISFEEDSRKREDRKLQNIRELHQRLKDSFPFDIINFDTYGSILDHTNRKNKLLYKSFEKIFELQKSIDSFLLFITIPLRHIDNTFEMKFKHDFESNILKYPEIGKALQLSIGTTYYNEIDKNNENKKTAICIAKSIILNVGRKNGWQGKHQGIYIYENKDHHKYLNSVVMFSKINVEVNNTAYVKDIINIIKKMPNYYSYQDACSNHEVIQHLNEIIEYREKIRQEKFRDEYN